ncbi:MAG: serine hydrolase [Pyrinomonadaceae bacterium]
MDGGIGYDKEARYGGSGVLVARMAWLTLRDCVNRMTVVSDKTAANMVIDYLTTAAVNERMNSFGLRARRIM